VNITAAQGLSIGSSSAVAVGEAVTRAQETTEERLRRLERKLYEQISRIAKAQSDFAALITRELAEERDQRAAADQEQSEILREAVVGKIHLNRAGVMWFVLGIIAGTASPEVSRVFAGAFCA
jgi:2-polyprenyl-6-methoxyphenol hydroxylase-like FAD-dependent oxidoreductase